MRRLEVPSHEQGFYQPRNRRAWRLRDGLDSLWLP
jgi:hypothetical protein